MALLIDGGRIPPRWAEKHPYSFTDYFGAGADCIKVALINNMPDPALEDTEMQFMELLDTASGDIPVRLKLYSLPGVPRGPRGGQHLEDFYFDLADLWKSPFDAIIMTGTEPQQPDLREEPYWRELADVLDWAERNTASTILSCLAAHAAVLHGDGIRRQRLADKRLGVFEAKACDHRFIRHAPGVIKFPHSRWNEVQANALTACGYSVLTMSDLAGVDMFAKERRNSLFVHFQGHPEYGAKTLLKEYRRDIKRFLRQERSTYPTMPHGYFDAASAKLLAEFQETAVNRGGEEQLIFFPEAIVAAALQNTWQSSAVFIYRNWLRYMWAKRRAVRAFAVVATSLAQTQRKRSVV